MECDKCGKKSKKFRLYDYCNNCGNNLCLDCFKKGCCGNIPAIPGMEIDNDNDNDNDNDDDV